MTDRPYRVLVTGSRIWPDHDVIYNALDAALNETPNGHEMWLVVGDCPRGADRIAYQWATAAMIPIDTHFADWNTHRNAAGPIRNAAMVKSGADVALAFIGPCASASCRKPRPHPSHGATNTVRLAERAGIPVRKWTA